MLATAPEVKALSSVMTMTPNAMAPPSSTARLNCWRVFRNAMRMTPSMRDHSCIALTGGVFSAIRSG